MTFVVIQKYSISIVIVLIPFYVYSCETRTRLCPFQHSTHRPSLTVTRHRVPRLINIIHPQRHLNHRHIRNISDVNPVYIAKEEIRVVGDKFCPVIMHVNSSVVEMCPTYDVYEYDENRTPPVMRQVKCRCTTSCLGPFTADQKKCEPVYSYEQVLRVVGCDQTNHYEYAYVWEPKSTGCECRTLADVEHRRMPP